MGIALIKAIFPGAEFQPAKDGTLVRFRIENYTSTDAGGHFLSSENRWLDTDIERDILGRPVAVVREVSGGEPHTP